MVDVEVGCSCCEPREWQFEAWTSSAVKLPATYGLETLSTISRMWSLLAKWGSLHNRPSASSWQQANLAA